MQKLFLFRFLIRPHSQFLKRAARRNAQITIIRSYLFIKTIDQLSVSDMKPHPFPALGVVRSLKITILLSARLFLLGAFHLFYR